MGTVPTVIVWSAGQFVTSTQMNTVGTALSFLLSPPRVLVYKNLASPWPSGTTPVTPGWNTEIVDTDTCWTLTNRGRLTANTAGLYLIEGAIHFPTITAGGTQCGVALNSNGTWPAIGSTNRLIESTLGFVGTGWGNSMNLSFSYPLQVGDYVEFYAAQNSGGSISAIPNGTYFDGHFGMKWIASS